MTKSKRLSNFLEKNNLNWEKIICDLQQETYDIIVIKDYNFKIIWTNKPHYFLDRHDITKRELYSNTCYKVFFQSNKPCNNCFVYKSKKSGKTEKGEVVLPNGDIILGCSHPIKINNKIVGFIKTGIDITEKKKIQEDLVHGGKITLKSEVGIGSEFTIKLPIKQIPEDEIQDYNKQENNILNRLEIEFSDIYS